MSGLLGALVFGLGAAVVLALVAAGVALALARWLPRVYVWWWAGWMTVATVLSALLFADGQWFWGLIGMAVAPAYGIQWWQLRTAARKGGKA